MKGLKEKLSLIYFPFLLITICFLVLYSLLNWILFIKTDFIDLKDDVVKFWLPFALPLILVLIWIRPGIKLLRFKNDNASFGYQVIASLVISFPTIVAQSYLETATGKLTKIESIAQFENAPKTKYYSLNTCFIDKSKVGILSTASVSGKHNGNLNLLIYITVPVFVNSSDTLRKESSYWIGKKYSKQVSNNLSSIEKESEFKEFAANCQFLFDTTNFQEFIYLERIGNNYDHDEFNKAVKKSVLVHYKDPVIFKAVNEPFEKRNGNKLVWIFIALGIGSLVFFIFILFPVLDKTKLAKFQKGVKTSDVDLKLMLNLFIPKKGFFATPIIIELNILIFLIMVFAGMGVISFQGENLLKWGALYRPYVINGEYWRLFTCMFLHGGLLHILANMAGLLFVGVFLEPLIGRTKYTIIYLLTGIAASCASIYWHPATVSIGASGAIFGLYGAVLALLLFKVYPADFNKAFFTSTLLFIGYNLLMGLTAGIDNAAHIGGLLSGFIIGLVLSYSLKRKGENKKY